MDIVKKAAKIKSTMPPRIIDFSDCFIIILSENFFYFLSIKDIKGVTENILYFE